MRRRKFIAGLGSAAAWPAVTRAQQLLGQIQRIGVLMSTANDAVGRFRIETLRRGLQELGWDKTNLEIELRWGNANIDMVQRYAEELVRMKPNVLVAGSTPALRALRSRTRTIPIVFAQVNDPVGQGLVESLARPGANITGFSNFEYTIGGKWLQLLEQIAPAIRSAAFMFNPDTAPYFDYYLRPLQTSVLPSLVKVVAAPVHSIADIESALMALGRGADAGLVVLPDTFTTVHRTLIASLAAQHRIPAIYPYRYFVADGGLVSYGTLTNELYLRTASYVDRILKGAKPADLPVQQPTKFELVINLGVAKALGLTIPETLLVTADEVIE